jgi:fructokinase
MKILSFGETIWDIFQDKKEIGGAPFNFTAHCAKLGAESYLVSSVGDDENGKEALEIAKNLGVKCNYVTIDRKRPTGACNVTLENGIPSYDLASNTAYDNIPDAVIYGDFDAIYVGTLALRSPQSRRSFEKILKYTSKKELFFDVNFRSNFYSRELVERILRETTILKVSEEEIGFFGKRDPLHTLLDISARFPRIKYICLTLGEEGAFVYDCRKRQMLCSEKPKSEVVSTVGAGDSFSACFLTSYLSGLDLGKCLDRAVILSDFVVGSLGAVPDYDPKTLFN